VKKKRVKGEIILLSSKEVAKVLKSDTQVSLTITTSHDLCSLPIPLCTTNAMFYGLSTAHQPNAPFAVTIPLHSDVR
jgi:hypothetical protein